MDESQTCILVIDDAPEYLDFMKMLLGSEGYAVATAPTLDGALAALASFRPALVLADVRLGELPPFAALDLLRADERTRHTPVVLCTGAVSELEAEAERLRRDGIEVLLKPFEIDALLSLVARLTGGPVHTRPEHGAE